MRYGRVTTSTPSSEPITFYSTDTGQPLPVMDYQKVNVLSVALGDTLYSFGIQAGRSSLFNVGDTVQACVAGNTFHLRSPEGKIYKSHIRKRERIS